MNGVCDTWCEGCIYLGKTSEVYCDYLLTEMHRRGCPAGTGCTARRRPPKWQKDTRLVWLEKATREKAKRDAAAPKRQALRRGRPHDPFCVSLTPEYINQKNRNYRARMLADEAIQAEGEAIFRWRKDLGLTQKDLGRLVGLGSSSISDWERGLVRARWDLLEPLGCPRPS